MIARDFMITCHIFLGIPKSPRLYRQLSANITTLGAVKQKVELVDNVASSHVRVTSVDTVSKSFSPLVLLDHLSLSNLTLVASSI